MQCSIDHILSKKREIVTKSWDLRIHKSTWEQLECQMNNAFQWDKVADGWLYLRESFV